MHVSRTFRPTLLIVAAAVILTAGACGNKSNTNTTDPPATNTQSITLNQNTNVPVVNTNQPVDPSETPVAASVSMTRSGFEPSTVTVKVNGTVTWVNNDTRPRQPASDPHPTHTTLPGFDALTGIAAGGQYQFTFTKVGTFGYHDHLNSFLTGTVVVVP